MSENKNQWDKFIHSKKFVISVITVTISVFIIVLLVKINNSGSKSAFGFGGRGNVTENNIRQGIINKTLTLSDSDSWTISEKEVADVKILSQEDGSDKDTRKIIFDLSLKSEVATAEGEVEGIFGLENGKWVLSSIRRKNTDDFKYKTIKDAMPNINEDIIKKCLQSEIISVKFGNNDMSFSVSTGKIDELKIKEMNELSDRGTVQNVLVNLKWTCKTTSVMGDIKLRLKYGSGNINIINNLIFEDNAKVEYIPPTNEDLRKDLVGEYLRIVPVSNSLKNTKTGKLVDVIFKLENEDIVTAEAAGFEYRSGYGIVNANVMVDRVKDRMTVKANVYMYYKLNKDVWKLDKVEPVNGYKSYSMEFR